MCTAVAHDGHESESSKPQIDIWTYIMHTYYYHSYMSHTWIIGRDGCGSAQFNIVPFTLCNNQI